MAEADSQQWGAFGQGPDQLHEAARLLWPARPWRQDHPVRCQPDQLFGGGRAGGDDPDLVAGNGHQLDQVVDERVLMVDYEDHGSSPPATAARIAEALASVSCSSRCGSESATIPAPAWTWTWPPVTTAVRMVMQKSRSPAKAR